MKTKSRNLLIVFLMAFAFVCGVFAITPLTANAAERAERDIVEVESGNSLNMRVDEQGFLRWDAVNGATGYQVIVRQNGMQVANWDTTDEILAFVPSMDGIKLDSGSYVIEIGAKGESKSGTMTYYYTSNVDKLEAPVNLQWLGNQAVWNYVDGAVSYKLNVYDSSGLVASKTVTECPVDLSEYNPQDGWTFQVQAQSNGTLKDMRNSAFQESPAKGKRTRVLSQNSDNSLNMRVDEQGFLKWDAVNGATGYHIILKKNSMEITDWETTNTSVLLVTDMDGIKLDSGSYVIEVGAKGVSKSDTMTYYYTSNVDKLEAPVNLQWSGNAATWSAVDGAAYYNVVLYNYEGRVITVPVNDTYYDFSGNEPQDGWTFKVQACSNGRLVDKRNSLYQESPAKETTYTITCLASEQGTVYIETNKGTSDYAAIVFGKATKNTEVTVKAVANSGYEFVEWKLNSPSELGVTCSTDATYSFNAASDIFIYAIFKSEFTVEYHGNGASGGMTGETVNAGGTHMLKECGFYPPSGKNFIGWAIGSAEATPLKQPGEQITVTKDTTIYAVWENRYFTTQPTNTSGKIGADVKLPVTIDLTQVPDEDEEYIVLEVKNGENWEKVAGSKRNDWIYSDGFDVQQSGACTKEYRYKIYNGTEWIESDTFTVEFLPIIVTFVDSTHSTITEPVEVDTVGGKITKPDNPTYSGDTFSGWWANGEWDFENRTVTQDITLYASWAECGYYGNIPNVYAKLGQKPIQRFMAIVKKYSDFDELTPEILRAYIDKVYIYEKQKVDGHYTHTVEIIYNLVGAIDLPDFGDLLDEEN